MGQEMFKLSVGTTGCGERFLSLLGKMYCGADDICQKLQEGLMRGQTTIDISDDTISFVCEGCIFSFRENATELLLIDSMLKNNSIQIESKKEHLEDGSFAGFTLIGS